MLRTAGFTPTVRPSSYEETLPCTLLPAEQAMFFALGKALDVRAQLAKEDSPSRESDALIVGADTIVVLDGRVLGKPRDEEDARSMLLALAGRSHKVMTGVCLAAANGSRTDCFYESTTVTFRNYEEAFLKAYLATEEAYDKAGGYAIQGTFRQHIASVDGDTDNVVGFPLSRFQSELARRSSITR